MYDHFFLQVILRSACLSEDVFSCPLDLSLGVWGRVSSQDVAKGSDKDFRKQAMQFTSSSLTATCQLCAVSLGDFPVAGFRTSTS